MKRFIFQLLLGFLLPQLVHANNLSVSLNTEIKKLFIKYKIPGASLAVIKDGKIVWEKTYGYADLETKRPVSRDTLFAACSVTKTLTSAAVLKTLQKYDIPLNAPVNIYLSRWKVPANKYTEQQAVTIRMLLNHTAGFSNPYPTGGYAYNAKIPTLTQLFRGESPATNPPLEITYLPGSQYKYCNGCYSVLQMFLEDVNKESYPVLMQKEILQPSGMTNSLFDNKLYLHSPTKIALPYDENRKRFTNAPTISPIYSTGDLWTTPTDLAKYIIQIQKSLNGQEGLLTIKEAKLLVTPDSTPTRGLGFFIGDKDGYDKPNGKYFFHTGNNIGYLSILIGSLDGKEGAAIMINISPEWNAKDYPQFGFIRDSLKVISNYYHWQN